MTGPARGSDRNEGGQPPSASLRDVARAAGVSTATASRVLSGSSHPVNEATRSRVLEAARQLDFQPNRLARALVTARSQTVGVLVRDVSDPYFGEILSGLEDVLSPRGYSLFVASWERRPEREADYLGAFESHRVDAIVLASSTTVDAAPGTSTWRVLERYRRDGGQVVALSEPGELPAHTVGYDNTQTTIIATEHLLQLGHRCIGFISGPEELEVSRRRLEGYRQALLHHGLPFDPGLVVGGRFSLEGGRRVVDALLQRGATGLVAANDMMALGALRRLAERGIATPAEVSVVGVDDITLAEYGPIPLTTVHVPTTELGRAGARSVLALLDGAAPPQENLQVWLVPRASTGPPPR